MSGRDDETETETGTGKLSERKRRRRVTTPPPPGSDPEPQSADARRHPPVLAAEDSPAAWGDVRYADDRAEGSRGPNDDRLRADKPPHYG